MDGKHELTPWGKLVKIRLLEQGLTLSSLRRQLLSMGIRTSATTLSGMLHGYRSGCRFADVVSEINRILDIPDEDAACSA